jgi:L-methionine (R)-S-oxide reductase
MHPVTQTDPSSTKARQYELIHRQLNDLLGGETDLIANAANTAALLSSLLPDVNWVGFYLWQDDQLVLGPFQGKPACTRIAVGQGVCGTAVKRRETVVVPNVNEFPGHIVCDPASQSEIVVPLFNWGKLVGVLDVDSASLERFDDDDIDGLETAASILLNSLDSDQMPDLSDAAAV